MIKLFAVGAMAAAVMFGSTLAASAQVELSPAQAAVMSACSGSGLADGGANCAIALAALKPGEYAAIKAAVEANVGGNVAALDAAIASSGVDTGAIGPSTDVGGPANTLDAPSGSPA